ncbi:DNA-binding CsgD family transcriptional regulator [Amorphus suaedae]
MPDLNGLARVIDRIGQADFGPALMDCLAAVVSADMCSAFSVTEGNAAVLVAESTMSERSAFARIASLRYAQRYWNRDLDTLYNLGRAHRHVLIARRPEKSIRDLEYRLECYGDGAVGERISICRTGGSGLIVNAYRLQESGPFPAAGMDLLEPIAPVLVAAVGRHARMLREAALPGAPDPIVLADRMRLSGYLPLSLREAQVMAALALGWTEAAAAHRLGVGLASVATYRKRGYAKLGLGSRGELRRLAEALWSGEGGGLGSPD